MFQFLTPKHLGPCGGSPCGPQMMPMPMPQNPCNGGGCGGMGQQVAYGIPDPIITESGGFCYILGSIVLLFIAEFDHSMLI